MKILSSFPGFCGKAGAIFPTRVAVEALNDAPAPYLAVTKDTRDCAAILQGQAGQVILSLLAVGQGRIAAAIEPSPRKKQPWVVFGVAVFIN